MAVADIHSAMRRVRSEFSGRLTLKVVLDKLEEIRDALKETGVTGLSAENIQGFGRQAGHTETYRGAEYEVDFSSDEAHAMTRAPISLASSTAARSSTTASSRRSPRC